MPHKTSEYSPHFPIYTPDNLSSFNSQGPRVWGAGVTKFSGKLGEGSQKLDLLKSVSLFLNLPLPNTISSHLASLVLHHSSVAATTRMQAQQE